jgi:hypothetical protein
MAKRSFFIQTSDLIRSFSTAHPAGIVAKVPWAITRETTMTEALNLLFEEGYADLLVINERTGMVEAIFSDTERTTTLSSKKKKEKKAVQVLEMQVGCHERCVEACKDRGGCKDHGAADFGDGPVCIMICNEGEEETVGTVLDAASGR